MDTPWPEAVSSLPPLSEAQRLDWLRLIRSENVGPATFRALINRYGGAAGALAALPELARRGGARALRIAGKAEAERELSNINAIGARVVALGEPEYPPALAFVDAPPPLLIMRGKNAVLKGRTVSIVGSRNASALGRRLTRMLAEEMGAEGYVIGSGLARGIDAAAHEASLPTGTIAVLAGGIDQVYPSEHRALYDRICEEGAVVSEMPFGWQAQARDFPRRNRIIAGLGLGVVVIEAAERSGSLITARLAGEMGREVFAVPGSPLDPRAAGTNRLIKEGATMTTGAEDVLEQLRVLNPSDWTATTPILFRSEDGEASETGPPEGERARLIDALGPAPVEVDVLIRETGLNSGFVQVILLELELAGRIERMHGNRVALIS